MKMNKKLLIVILVVVVAIVLFALFVLPSLLSTGTGVENIFGLPAAGSTPPALPE